MTARDTDGPKSPADAPADGNFLRRWSQRKHAVARGETPVEPPSVPVATPPAQDEPPLPDPATLTLADDFSVFLRDKVPPALKRKAMQQLFSHAQFNQVDGLDVYMEDFNDVANLDSASLALVKHARAVLDPTPPEAEADNLAHAPDDAPALVDAETDADTRAAPASDDTVTPVAQAAPAIGENGRPESA